jgi:MoaA/NifB/PqqE/SkfB family radical SAM enzyme
VNAPLDALRNASGRKSPVIGIEVTVMRRNLKEIKPMIKLAKSIGVDFIEAWSLNEIPDNSADSWKVTYHGVRSRRPWRFFAPSQFSYAEQKLSLLPREEITKATELWMAYAKKVGVPFAFFVLGEWNVSEDYPPAWTDSAEPDPVIWQENSIRCSLPWREMRTDYDGGVTACCWGPKKLGSLREQTMKEIWNGETMQEMRSDLVAGRVPDACKGSACQFLSKRG